ncbi:MAG: hypothetical protein JO352_17085 [Chloroflexi bacterium]|nr:hypothetical protein [Chloroflexota bacterium]
MPAPYACCRGHVGGGALVDTNEAVWRLVSRRVRAAGGPRRAILRAGCMTGRRTWLPSARVDSPMMMMMMMPTWTPRPTTVATRRAMLSILDGQRTRHSAQQASVTCAPRPPAARL